MTQPQQESKLQARLVGRGEAGCLGALHGNAKPQGSGKMSQGPAVRSCSDLQGGKTSEPWPGQAGSGAPASCQPLLCSISSEVSERGE